MHLKINRAIAGQFAVKLQGNILFTGHAKAASLEIFNFWNADVRAEYNVMEIFNDFEEAQSFKHNHIK